jgi:putative methionine-R-sulfoxide reductase with GAF domain
MGRGPKPAKGKAKPAVARKSSTNDAARVRDLEKRLAEALQREAEALEQQTATTEVLSIISASPTDLQPVLDAVVKSAARFCSTDNATIFQVDGDTLCVVAHHGPIPVDVGLRVPCGRGTVSGRTVLERRAFHVTDLQAEAAEFPEGSANARRFGHRTTLSVPLLREGRAIGAIQLRRPEAERFTNKQVALLQTFADQAVIAIENARLFNETKEALEQQTATSEILRVISQSPTDVQPVFDAIADSAVRLCESSFSVVHRFDGTNIELPIAMCNVTDEQMALYRRIFPLAASMATSLGESALTRRTVHVEDTLAEGRYTADTEAALFSQADRTRGDLRRPSGDRDRERAAVHRTAGEQPRVDHGAGHADCHQRHPARHQPLADGCAAGVRHDPGQRSPLAARVLGPSDADRGRSDRARRAHEH